MNNQHVCPPRSFPQQQPMASGPPPKMYQTCQQPQEPQQPYPTCQQPQQQPKLDLQMYPTVQPTVTETNDEELFFPPDDLLIEQINTLSKIQDTMNIINEKLEFFIACYTKTNRLYNPYIKKKDPNEKPKPHNKKSDN